MSKCFYCVHYMGNKKCEAFGVEEIPDAIFDDAIEHTSHMPGDGGVVFEHKNDITVEG